GDATAIYAASLWMGGTDVNGQLKLAAVTFRQDGNDFWPGPLSTNAGSGNYDPLVPQGDNTVHDYGDANVDPSVCQTYDNIFSIRKAEVVAFITWWECNNPNPFNPNFDGCEEVSAPDNEVLARITAWPGNGNITLFQDPFLAPYYDRNQDLYYNPLDGDYPWYDDILGRDDIQCGVDRRISLFGDDTHWWVFNDKGNAHTESGGQPIGMEIRAQAFSFATDDEINKMTFYNYELINRGTQTLYNTYFAQYVDSDLGNYSDDYVGCDVTRGLGYIYNGDLNDETQSGKTGYGQNPPSLGIDFFEGPYQDPDGRDNVGPVTDPITGVVTTPTVAAAIADTGIVYKGLGIGYGDGISDNERFGMRLFKYYTSNAAQSQSDPSSAAQFYNYMKGAWRFGDNSYYGGTGFTPSAGVTTILANYMFPGDSDSLNWGTAGIDPGFDWSEFD
ncbi:MAG: T9SS C-terminal target domain-containing protein, partial [Flavobacteriia bacterium]|nr:T9SS C-terminal target domain-containing protein [Flavobacteriia bacterium]